MALCSLEIKDARARYGVLKVRGVGLDGAGGSTAQPLLGGRLPGRPTDKWDGTLEGAHAQALRPRGVAAITGGLPLQNGTEGQDLRLGTVGGNCTFDGRAAWGPNSQWSTGCSLE